MTAKHIRFEDDDEFAYEPSDSEDDYSPQEKELMKEVLHGNEHESDSEVEVFGVGAHTSSDDDSAIALSDVEGQGDDDDLPDVRAWGKDKRSFYSTDYVDQDYGGFQGQDAVLADLEEREAKDLQKQLIEQMDEDDFAFDLITKETKVDDKQMEEVVKTDISKLSKRQRIELLHKESPEFFGLVDDFKNKMSIVRDFLLPVLTLAKENKINDSNALKFANVYFGVISNYCTNINMYLLLKASRVNVQNHPVIKRLFQYRKLLNQLDPLFEEEIKPQVTGLLEANSNGETGKTKKLLKLLRKSTKKLKEGKKEQAPTDSKKRKLERMEKEELSNKVTTVEEIAEAEENEDKLDDIDVDSRRAITYQIAKNKGLTPHRNKLQRNPRVKNRNKYRKALIRRKGAVRQVRTELSRYGGELSGIKASVSKSIKIKS